METRSQTKRKLNDIQNFGIKILRNDDTPTRLRSGRILSYNSPLHQLKEACEEDSSSHNNKASENLAQTFPPIPLKEIFKHLPVDDLINCQFVCTHWTDVIQDSHIWENKIWILKDSDRLYNAYKQQLVNAPLICNVVIPTKNVWFSKVLENKLSNNNLEVLETVLLHQQNLLSLKVSKFPVNLIYKIVAKFPNLEKIHVGVCHHDAFEVLKVLNSCKHLQELKFIYIPYWKDLLDHAGNISRLLSESFQSLTSLDMPYFQEILPPEDISNILTKKICKLKKLTFMYTERTSIGDLNIISQFPNIELKLCIYKRFDLNILKNVRVLSLSISEKDIEFFIAANICLINVESLDISQYEYNPEIDYLNSMKVMFPNLKFLRFQVITKTELNNHFVHLAEFQQLRIVSLVQAYGINKVGFSHLSKCSALESLTVSCATLDEHSVSAISLCSTLRHLKLKSCVWNATTEDVLSMISSLHNLQYLKLVQSDYTRKPGIYLSVPVIRSKCTSRNIRLETQDWLEMNL